MPDLLHDQLDRIELPPQLHARCMQGVRRAQLTKKGSVMNKNNTARKPVRFPFARRFAAVAAAAALCTAVLSATAFADSLRGYFVDIVRWDGAVTGTQYQNATEELSVSAGTPAAQEEEIRLPVSIVVADPSAAPFLYLEQLSLQEYTLQDAAGRPVDTAVAAEEAPLQDGTAQLMLTLPVDLPAGQYTLTVTAFAGGSKADAPLLITGEWVCSFVLD